MPVGSWSAITGIMVGLKMDFGKFSERLLIVGGGMTSIDSVTSDYRTITEDCGLLDRSERGKLALSGTEAKTFLQGQVSNDVEVLEPGRGCYAAFLTPKGKML